MIGPRFTLLAVLLVSAGILVLSCNVAAWDDTKKQDKPASAAKTGSAATAPAQKEKGKADDQDAKKDTAKDDKDMKKDKDDKEMKKDDEPKTPTELNDWKTIGFINEQIDKGWKDNKIQPSVFASDYEWIRRVFIDMIGRVPTALPSPNVTAKEDPIAAKGELPYFLDVTANKRRSAVIRYLLNHPDYAKHWANIWTVWLITRTTQPGIDRQNLHSWLERQFGENRRYDEIVTDLLTATGKADDKVDKKAPATNFLLSHFGEVVPPDRRGRDGQFEMIPATSRVTRLFLGIQTQCTQCHDHPFIDDRKQGQFWGVNVFLRQAEREPATIMVQNNRMMALRHYELRDNLSANPENGIFYERRNGLLLRTSAMWLDSQKPTLSRNMSRRQELSRLLINDEFFAKEIVNRMWAHFFGRGFTNPIDDFGEHNQPSHPELLNRLAQDFITSGYDLQRLITWITSSKPYHLTSVANNTNWKSDAEPYFARMQLKAMSPEVLVDSIFTATSATLLKISPESRRKMEQEWLRDFTVNFGDDEGNEATFNGTVVQALLLMNGNKLNEAVNNSMPVKRAIGSNKPLEVLYLTALSRIPTSKEKEAFNHATQTPPYANIYMKDPEKLCCDVLWALFNSNEFILNH